MKPALVALCLTILLPAPALAHRLKVFAAVEDGAIFGYGFFVGGGRPADVPFRIENGSGAALFSGRTDAEGGFRWPVPEPADYTVTINAEDGHAASTRISAARFAGGGLPLVEATATPVGTDGRADTPDALGQVVETAVQRQVAPLLERIEEMDNRLRLTDIVSGVFLILGAAGGWLGLRARRRE